MAASSSDIGANFSQYQGDVNLGGGSFGFAKLDTRPIEDLARYTFLYNKSLFDQRQKDADEKIFQIAKLADIHVNDLRGKDRDELIKEFNETIEYAQEYARKIPKNPKEKIEQNLEWQKKTIGLFNNHLSGKARSIKYTAELDKIENDKSLLEETKAIKRKQLDDLFDKTKISEQFGNVPDYTLTSLTIPTPATLTANIIQEGANANVDDKLTFFNYKANAQAAFDILNGLDTLYPSDKTPQGQTRQARQQRTIESEAKAFRDSAEVLNSVLQSKDASGNLIYYKTDASGNLIFDEKKFLDDIPPTNTLLLRSFTALKNMDADARAKYNQALQGKLSDRGFGFNLPPNVVANDFKTGFVDFTKPISAEQIVTAGIFSHYAGDKVEKAVQLSDNDIQREQLALARKNFDLEEKKFKASTVGGELDKNAALAFANNLFDDIASKGTRTKDGNVVLTPDDVRKLGQDQLKYLGIETPVKRDEEGKIIESAGLQPLSLGKDDLIQLEPDGTIKVMKTAKFDEKQRRWFGPWDPTRSTSVWNAARNLLNEENVKSGTKERNAYSLIDLRGKDGVIYIDSSGGKKTQEIQLKAKQIKGKTGKPIYVPGQ